MELNDPIKGNLLVSEPSIIGDAITLGFLKTIN